MTLTDRDRKIMLLLIPVALIAAYWLLVLAPKREQSASIQTQLTQAQSERDTAVQKLAGLTAAKRSFATDYATVISLGKSIPVGVEMPSLLVQLDQAAKGTGIRFTSIQTGDRTGAGSSPAGGTTAGSKPNGGSGPASSSTPAQSGSGKAAQAAGGAVGTSNNASAAAGASNSTGSTTPAAGTGSSGGSNANLDSVPLDFTFKGSFFDLTDFFHRMKRFVRVANHRIVVNGRLLTINSFTFDAKQSFPNIKASVHATVYLAPKAEGVSAGANPSGPAGAPASGQGAGQSASSSTPPTPAATVTAP